VLCVKGELLVKDKNAVAMVGSRMTTVGQLLFTGLGISETSRNGRTTTRIKKRSTVCCVM
jgi:hypothetical protein